MPHLHTSSTSSPSFRLEGYSPLRIRCSLHLLALLALGSLLLCGLAIPVKIGCALLLLLYWRRSVKNLIRNQSTSYALTDGSWTIEREGQSYPLAEVAWRSFGHLLEMRATCGRKQTVQYWWMPSVPPDQAVQLRRIVNVKPTGAAKKMPSVLANPVL